MTTNQTVWIAEALAYTGDACLLWPFTQTPKGYPQARMANGATGRVNRYVCEKAHGAPPSKAHHAAHSCGTRLCLNPKHLGWATAYENNLDILKHGRRRTGEHKKLSKLTEQDVREIRASTLSQRALARRYGVCQAVISQVVRRAAWKCVA